MNKIRITTLLIMMIFTTSILGFNNFTGSTISAKAAGELTGLTAREIVDDMGLGWNLGNTFDATGGNRANIYSQETSWGNPKVTPELIKAVHDRGFKTIRIPVTWNNHIIKDGAYTINPEFLARIKEVVDYAYDLDMYIILNLHHESWLNIKNLDKNYAQVGEELEAVWTQIAEYFANYDQHLIFEGMNEPRMAGSDIEWTGNQEAYKAVNYLNQIFTYTVRNTKMGHNDERCLMIPGYAASSNLDILKTITIPTFEGEAVKNIIISVHCYNPYNFCLSDEMYDFDPTDKNHTSSIDSLFKNLEELFLFNDIPVVIGETSATNKNNTEARENWAGYMGKKSFEYGIPIVLWDNGANGHSGGECHAWILRSKCEWNYVTVVNKLFEAAGSTEWGSLTTTDRIAHDIVSSKDVSLAGGNTIWQDHENGHIVAGIEYSHAQPLSIPMVRSYVTSSSEIAVCYTGNDSPLLYFETEENGLVTSGIAPYKTETKSGNAGNSEYNIAYYKYRTINDTLKSAGITNPSQLSQLVIASAGADINILEVSILSLNATASFFAGGQSFNTAKGATLLPGLKILGWYTTMDYKEGTEYTGESFKDTTYYAKVFWEKDYVARAQYEKIYGPEDPDTIIDPDTDEGDKDNNSSDNNTGNNTSDKDNGGNTNNSGNTDNDSNTGNNSNTDTTDSDNSNSGSSNTGNSSSGNTENSADNSTDSGFPVIPVLIIILAFVAIISGVTSVLLLKKKNNKK